MLLSRPVKRRLSLRLLAGFLLLVSGPLLAQEDPTEKDPAAAVVLTGSGTGSLVVSGSATPLAFGTTATGLLVELDSRGGTLADLAVALRYKGISAGAVVVAGPGLGTLNHTALTAEALARRGIPLLGVIVGTWPQSPHEPDLAMQENLTDLPKAAQAPIVGRITDHAGSLSSVDFRRAVATWLTVG